MKDGCKERLEVGHPSAKAEGQANAGSDVTGNGRRSRIRSAVEHVFAGQTSKMKFFIRTIGIKRATVKIGMPDIAYNMLRYVFHEGNRTAA